MARKKAVKRRASKPKSGSVIPKDYQAEYTPDDLALRIRKTFTADDGKIDWPAFIKFAKANDCWNEAYTKLNAGMQRMNIVNRLRARVRKGDKVVWL
jgi:hypothetical protein